jgi:hypothetical protein
MIVKKIFFLGFLFFMVLHVFSQDYQIGEVVDASLLDGWRIKNLDNINFLNYTWKRNGFTNSDRIITEMSYEITHETEQEQKDVSNNLTPVIFSYANSNGYTMQKKIIFKQVETYLFMNPNNNTGILFYSGVDSFAQSLRIEQFITEITFIANGKYYWDKR